MREQRATPSPNAVVIASRVPRLYLVDGVIEDGGSMRSRWRMLWLRSTARLFADFGSDYGVYHRAYLFRRFGWRLAFIVAAALTAVFAVGWTWPMWLLVVPTMLAVSGVVVVSAVGAAALTPFFGHLWWLPLVAVIAGVLHERTVERARTSTDALPRWRPIRLLPLRERVFLTRRRLRFKVIIALDLTSSGFPTRAGADVEALLEAIGDRAPACRSMLLLAKAGVAFEKNDHDAALLLTESARREARDAGAGPRAWVELGAGKLYAELGDRVGARAMTRAAMELAPRYAYGLRFEANLRYGLLSAEVGQRDAAVAAIHRARLGSIRHRDLLGMIATEVALLRAAEIPGKEQAAVLEWLADLVRAEYKHAPVVPQAFIAVVESFAGRLALECGNSGDAADHLSRAAVAFRRARQVVEEAMVLADFAQLLAGNKPISHIEDDTEQRAHDCIDFACWAIDTFHAVRYALPTSQWRQAWIRSLSDTYDLVLRKTHASGQHERVAALVELSKSQAVPVPIESRVPQRHDMFDLLLRARATVVGTVRHPGDRELAKYDVLRTVVSADPVHDVAPPIVGGVPALPDKTDRVGIDVDDAVTRICGPDAFYFTAAVTGRHYVWAFRAPGGRWTSGLVALTEWSGATRPVDELLDALPVRRAEERNRDYRIRVARSVLLQDQGDPRAESELLRRAGCALVPRELVQALRAARQRDGLPRLLVSMPGMLSAVPLAFLGVDEPDVRLIEIADIQVLPSIELVSRAPVRVTARETQDWPVNVAGTFAVEGLSQPGPPPGAAFVIDENTDLAQRKQRLLRALFDARSRGGTAYLSGHLKPGGDGATPEPLVVGLQLADGQGEDRILTVRDLLATADGGRNSLPERVLLFACSTLGVQDAGTIPGRTPSPSSAVSRWPLTGEWVGFSAACLLAGASVVVCTHFDQPDVSGGAMDHDVAAEIIRSPDPVRGLSSLLRRVVAERRAGKPGRAITPMCYAIVSITPYERRDG